MVDLVVRSWNGEAHVRIETAPQKKKDPGMLGGEILRIKVKPEVKLYALAILERVYAEEIAEAKAKAGLT